MLKNLVGLVDCIRTFFNFWRGLFPKYSHNLVLQFLLLIDDLVVFPCVVLHRLVEIVSFHALTEQT